MGAALKHSPARVFARPTADSIWLGPALAAARSRLLRGTPVRLLVGPPSSGKSTLLAHVGALLANEAAVLALRGPYETREALLTALLRSADLWPADLSETELRNLLTVFIQQRRGQRKRVVALIDDADTLGAEAWEELERLSAWRPERRPALEFVLAGGTLLAHRHARRWLDDRPEDVTLEELPRPTVADVTSYIDWRLAGFELDGLITPVAAQMIARSTGGRFAAVDILCQMALLLLRRHGLERVDARIVRQALAALGARRHEPFDADAKVPLPPPLAPSPPSAPSPARREPPAGHLLVSRDGKLLQRVPLGSRVLLGRSRHNDVCLPSPYLGRHHAVIVGTPEGYYVVDLNSLNGLKVNGRPTARAILSDQDVLTLGPFRIKVRLPEWITEGNPLPDPDSLADTAVLNEVGDDRSRTLTRIK